MSRGEAGRADADVAHREALPAISLSIVICSCNRSASLAKTLASVNACRLPPGHPVDARGDRQRLDGRHGRVCADFALVARMPFRRVLETRPGLSFARNRGVQEAAGDVVIFTDDDVLVDEKWIVIYAQEFRREPRRLRVWPGSSRLARLPTPVVQRPSASGVRAPRLWRRPLGRDRRVPRVLRGELRCPQGRHRRNWRIRRTSRTHKEKLYIGEETRIYRDLLSRGRAIVYNPLIDVKHVIEESRKEKAYLLKYYAETARLSVYMSLRGSPKRRVLGIPLVRAKAFAAFYAAALPRLVHLALKRDAAGLFALRLIGRRNWRMILLYVRARFAHVD